MKIIKSLKELLEQTRPSLNRSTCDWFRAFLKRHVNGYVIHEDKANNFWLTVGNEPRHCYTSHYDTVHSRFEKNKVYGNESTGIISTDSKRGGTPLGADDAAGIVIMLELIGEGVEGHYIFFADEERGGIGSSAFDIDRLGAIDLILSLDRAGTDDVIIEQSIGECASEECGQWLADRLNATDSTFDYKNSRLGTFTDSANFAETVPECLNLSVGYGDQHTHRETLDYTFLMRLIDSLKTIDLSKAPLKRKAGDFGDFSYSGFKFKWEDYDYSYKSDYAAISQYDQLLELISFDPDLVADYLTQYGITASDIRASACTGKKHG